MMTVVTAPVGAPVVALDRDTVLHQVYVEQYEALVRLARLLVDDRGSAEEVVQEAFARTYASWRRVRDAEQPLPYVKTSVLNLARGRLRRRSTRRQHRLEAPRHAPGADEAVIGEERSRSLTSAVRALPRRQREVVVLRYFEDCPTAEAAKILGITEGTVKSQLHKALATLSEELEDLR